MNFGHGLPPDSEADPGTGHTLRSLLAAVTAIALALPLAALGLVGWFARYAADDYCTASQLATAGLVKAQSILYVSWSGRFAATLLITVSEIFGPVAVRVLPMLTLMVWVAATLWAVRQLSCRPWLPCAAVAMLVIYTTLQTTADLPQVLYWQTGLLTYVAPLVLFTVLLGWIARLASKPRWSAGRDLAVCVMLAFVAGGTNETFGAAQVTTFAVGALLMPVFAGPRLRARLIFTALAGLLGAVLAVAVVAAAPGNAVRSGSTIILPITEVLLRSIDFTRGWLRLTFARPHAIDLLLLIGVVAVVGGATRPVRPLVHRPRWSLVLLMMAATALVLVACMVPVYYALDADPPGRALLVPQYILICVVAMGAWCGGERVAQLVSVGPGAAWGMRWVGAVGLVVLLGAGPVLATTGILRQLSPDRAYAGSWDTLDAQIRAEEAQGVRDVTVPRLDSTGTVHNLDFFGPDRQDWLNECVARYYAVNSIASTS